MISWVSALGELIRTCVRTPHLEFGLGLSILLVFICLDQCSVEAWLALCDAASGVRNTNKFTFDNVKLSCYRLNPTYSLFIEWDLPLPCQFQNIPLVQIALFISRGVRMVIVRIIGLDLSWQIEVRVGPGLDKIISSQLWSSDPQ